MQNISEVIVLLVYIGSFIKIKPVNWLGAFILTNDYMIEIFTGVIEPKGVLTGSNAAVMSLQFNTEV